MHRRARFSLQPAKVSRHLPAYRIWGVCDHVASLLDCPRAFFQSWAGAGSACQSPPPRPAGSAAPTPTSASNLRLWAAGSAPSLRPPPGRPLPAAEPASASPHGGPCGGCGDQAGQAIGAGSGHHASMCSRPTPILLCAEKRRQRPGPMGDLLLRMIAPAAIDWRSASATGRPVSNTAPRLALACTPGRHLLPYRAWAERLLSLSYLHASGGHCLG